MNLPGSGLQHSADDPVPRGTRQSTESRFDSTNSYFPYGYHHAQGDGWSITCSKDAEESSLVELLRRGLTRTLGFDLIHAWRNRAGLHSADVIWTHTEREHLAVALILWLRRKPAPKLVAQCIWLFDKWSRFSAPRRALYTHLLRFADIVTTQSPEDLKLAQAALPGHPTECILSGATIEWMRQPRDRAPHRPLRLPSLGNDMHRDWDTMLAAFGGRKEYEVVIASKELSPRRIRQLSNVTLVKADTAAEVSGIYEWADMVVVSLKANHHASGITVLFEGIMSGIPVIVTDTGGLRAYFSEDEVGYVPVNAPSEMRAMADMLVIDLERRLAMVAKAQERLLDAELTKQGYAARHRRLTERLLAIPEKSPRCNAAIEPREQSREVKVFVLLGYGFGVNRWRDRYERGQIPGLN
jgi:glycosyltransferase involved in cell wall biosynthesis